VCSRAASPEAAQALVEQLAADSSRAQRLAGGFEER
jgi:hypothetical protein